MNKIDKYASNTGLMHGFNQKLITTLEDDEFDFLFTKAKLLFDKEQWEVANTEFSKLQLKYPHKAQLYPYLCYTQYKKNCNYEISGTLLFPLKNDLILFMSEMWGIFPKSKFLELKDELISIVEKKCEDKFCLGLLYYKLDEDEKVIEIFQDISLNEASLEFWRYVVLAISVSLARKDYALSNDYLQRAQNIYGEHIFLLYNRGLLAEQMENLPAAINFLDNAIAIHEHPYLFSRRAWVNKQLEQLNDAEKDYKKAIEISKIVDWQDYCDLGKVLTELGRYEEASSYLIKAIGINECEETNLALGEMYFFSNDYINALKYHKKTLEYDSDYPGYNFLVAKTYSKLPNCSDGLNYINRALELRNDTDHYYALRAAIFTKMDEYNKAIIDLDRAIEICDNEWFYYADRGMNYFYIQNYNNAILDFSKSIKIQPYNYTYYFRALCYFFNNNFENAIEDFSYVIISKPEQDGEALFYRARCSISLKKYDEAILDLTKSVQIQSENIEAHYWLGVSYSIKGDFENALKHIDIFIDLNESNASGYFIKGYCNSQMNEPLNAIAAYEKAVLLGYDKDVILTDLAENYLIANEFEKAIIVIEEAIQLEPNKIANIYLKFRISIKMGNFSNAVQEMLFVMKNSTKYDYKIYFTVMQLCQTYENVENLIPLLNELIAIRPSVIALYRARYTIHKKLHNFSEMLIDMRFIISNTPDIQNDGLS